MPLEIGTLQRDSLVRSGEAHYTGSEDASTSTTNFTLVDGQRYEIELQVQARFYDADGEHYASTGYEVGDTDGFDLGGALETIGTTKLYCYRSGSTLYASLHPDFLTSETKSYDLYTQTTQRSLYVAAGEERDLDWTGEKAMTVAASIDFSAFTFSLDASNQLVITSNAVFVSSGDIDIGADGYVFLLAGGQGSPFPPLDSYNHTDGYDPDTGYAITTAGLSCIWVYNLRVATIN